MKIQIYKYNNPESPVFEIREILSDSSADTLTHYVPPMGYPEIIFYLGKKHQIKNTICKNGFIKGQYTNAQKIEFLANYHFVSIALHPYGLKQLFNINADELINSVIDIEEHPVTRYLSSHFATKKETDISFINSLIHTINQFPQYSVSDATKEYIKTVAQSEQTSVNDIVKLKGIGLRTLQRKFKKEVGLTPNQFMRILRINKVEGRLSDNTNTFQIIADYNFYDQSHLIKEFNQWRNFSPNELIKKKLRLSDQLPQPKLIQL